MTAAAVLLGCSGAPSCSLTIDGAAFVDNTHYYDEDGAVEPNATSPTTDRVRGEAKRMPCLAIALLK